MSSKFANNPVPPASGLRLAELPRHRDHEVRLVPDETELRQLRQALGLTGLAKVRLEAKLIPVGKQDWDLRGKIGATVTQNCVVTLAPVRTRIDENIERSYRAHAPDEDDAAGEVEIPEDDSIEPLPDYLDLLALISEAIGLALPPYPRAEGAELGRAIFAADDVTPMSDEDAKPFAGLTGLRDKLKDDESE